MSRARRRFRAAGDIARLDGLADLIAATEALTFSSEDVPHPDLSQPAQSWAIVNQGYDILPGIYDQDYLDGLKDFVDSYTYESILTQLDRDGEGPWRDWHAAIQQRTLDERRAETHAFLEVVRDLFDGFLSLEERLGVEPPDKQVIAPLVKWGGPDFGPYTWPAHWSDFGIRTSVVSMPPAYSRNVALWAALGHETTGHDILEADTGLLPELADKVAAALQGSSLTGEVMHYGQAVPMKDFAAEYWTRVIGETASDVCGVLNLGPAAAIGLAALFIPFGGGALSSWTTTQDPHPIDLSRLWLAAELIDGLIYFDQDRRTAWINALDGIADGWGETGDLELRYRLWGSWFTTTTIPRDEFRESARIVAHTIAFEKMASLQNRSLADINTWTTMDEALADGVAQDLLAGRAVEMQDTAEVTTYAAHVLSGGVLAMCTQGADIDGIHDGTIQALSTLYDQNPTWGGMPARMPRDPARHTLFPVARKPAGVKKKKTGARQVDIPRGKGKGRGKPVGR